MTAALEARELVRTFRRGSEEVRAVDGVTLTIGRGEFVALVGPSGSGKTTLVNLLGCLDNPTSGELTVAGRPVFGGTPLPERELTRVRRDAFGYVFQSFFLIPSLTVRENVLLPLTFFRKPGTGDDVDAILDRLGIGHRAGHLPGQISGGEMQRVAIARALVNRPEILLADEPTGNLDSRRSAEIGGIIRDLSRDGGITVIMVTHNAELAALADRIVEMKDGRLSS